MLDKTIKQDSRIMELLKVSTINRIICSTDKGMLTLQIRKGDKGYHLVLDAVPLDKEKNDELMSILFPKPEAIVPQVNKQMTWNGEPISDDSEKAKQLKELNPDKTGQVKPKGRPKGSRNALVTAK